MTVHFPSLLTEFLTTVWKYTGLLAVKNYVRCRERDVLYKQNFSIFFIFRNKWTPNFCVNQTYFCNILFYILSSSAIVLLRKRAGCFTFIESLFLRVSV